MGLGCEAGPGWEVWGEAAPVGSVFPGSTCRSVVVVVGAESVTCARTLR